jgi:hypothetical protein
MLTEWYFCCCIGANSSDTETFLSILESIENPESDHQLLYLAYEELKQTEDKMQIYALPTVLKSLYQDNLPTGIQKTIKQYLKHLVENVPEVVASSVGQIVNLVLSNQPSTKIIELINTFVQQSKNLPERWLSSTPYLDLKEFLPETIVLAILANLLENDETLIARIVAEVNKQNETSSPISDFLQKSLECQFGRMAFRFSVSIASLTSIEDPDRLRSLIAKQASLTAQGEPDLLQTYSVVLFGGANNTSVSQCQRVIQESLTLSELRNLILETSDQNRDNLDALFRRVGIQKTPNRTESLPIIYWQITLWELAVQADALTVADELVKFWKPNRIPNNLCINCSAMDITEQVKKQFISLLELRNLQINIPLHVNKDTSLKANNKNVLPTIDLKRFSFNEQSAWIFFSPWIARTENPKNLYPVSDEPVILIRLMGSVSIAIQLLQKLAQKNFDRVKFAARLLAHVSDINAIVNRRYNEGKAHQLSPALMGLFRFTQRQIKVVGTGQFESIAPQIFLKIYEGQSHQQENSYTNREESLFFSSVLPEVMISWILDAYPSVVRSKLSGRWLNLIPDVYNYHREGRHSFGERQKATLVTRFLCPSYSLPSDDRLDWKIEKLNNFTNKSRWEANYRKLLLTNRLHPNDWIIESEWDDECVNWGSDSSRIKSNRLVYTLELLDAIGNYSPHYHIDSTVLEKIFDEWKHCLNSISEAKNLDRFTRLRLLEFLDSLILENRSEEQILIASVLLEYGSIYELKNMLERVYAIEADGQTFKNVGSARQQLQISLVTMIYHRLEKDTEMMQEIDDQDYILKDRLRKAQNPREIFKKLEYAELFKEWIIKVFYLSNTLANTDVFRELGDRLAKLRSLSLERQASSTIRTKTLNVELRNNQKLLVLPPGDLPLADIAIKAINYNPNRFTAKVFYEDFDTTEVENLFKKKSAEIRNLKHEIESPLHVLAVVVDAPEKQEKEPYQYNYTFDCGLKFLLARSSDRLLDLKSGDRVKLPIQQFKEEEKLWWRISDNLSIPLLTHKCFPGDINSITVNETWKDGQRCNPDLFLKISNRKQERIVGNTHLWDADISRSFCQRSQSLERQVFAKLNTHQKWIPLDLDFSDLLFQTLNSQVCNNIAVLTLIEEETGQFGEKAWRFSCHPGENYLIERHRFLADDATRLEDEIAKYQNGKDGATGLLVSITPDFESDRVRLRLVNNAINITVIEDFYPDLSFPFDDRNIRWRKLFARPDERFFTKKDTYGNWFFYLPEDIVIPGYPRQVKVTWHYPKPTQSESDADLLIIQWKESEWRCATVHGETTPFHQITPYNNDWVSFLDRWLNLPKRQYIEAGCRISLKGERSLGWVDPEGDGFVPCLTTENIRILVQVESITMLPLEPQMQLSIGKNREAEIFWIEWFDNKTYPEINNIDIPPNAVENHQCVGIITKVPKPGTGGIYCQVVWQMSQGTIEEQGLQIDNLATLRVALGDKIVGQQNRGKWVFHIEKPNIRARALWLQKQWKSGLSDIYYLGVVSSSDGEDLEIAESSPGELVCLPHQPNEFFHLAVGTENKPKNLMFIENSIWENNRTNNTARHRYAFDEPAYQYRRAVIMLGKQLLIGNCREWIGDEKVSVQTVELIQSQRDNGKYVLQRRFDLRQIREIKDHDKNTSDKKDLWKQKLEDYLKEPKPLRANFAKSNKGKLGFLLSKGGADEIRVPEDSSWENWTRWVPLALEQGKFVIGGNYSDRARVLLFTNGEGIWASCRQVKPLTLEEFRINYCEASPLNTDILLLKDKDIHLYYVGPEQINESTGEQYAEIHHRFEMGYGKTLLIPESQLEFDSGSFSKAQFFLFYGDLIKVISFKHQILEDSVVNQAQQNILNIKGIHLQWSEARQLYNQSTRYQIVHLLHLNPQNKEIEISYIDGFNEHAIAQQRRFETKKFKADLTLESKNQLTGRWEKWQQEGELDPVVFGRLDRERFENSYGRDIYFDQVRLSFIQSSKGSCLIDKDLVFLSANRIKPLKNDMGLTLKPPKGFDSEDIGKDAKSLMLLRRSFSVRENLLKQVYEEKGENYFQDDRLLIQLTQDNERRIISRLLLEGDNTPSRQASALIGAVSNLGKAGLLATIVAEDSGIMQLEYKPGIFFRLKAHQIQSPSSNLSRGTIVHLETFNGKLSISRAAFGNSEYISENVRPVVILPTNDIKDKKPEVWAREGRCTIGGLPNIIAYFASQTNDRGNITLVSREIMNLMVTRHPKIIHLTKDTRGIYQIKSAADIPTGRLSMIENSLSVQYLPLNSDSTHSSNFTSIPWHLLSFGDESVQQILDRVNIESWRYHDNQTFTWIPETEEFEIEKLDDRNHTVWTGPIFFQSSEESLRLRYSQSEFRRFGFPVEELIYTLKQRGHSHCYPIAGISESPDSSLWIELAPGRLVELPVKLIVWRSGINEKMKSIADLMHWQGFAPGDRVELELVSTDLLTIAQIVLKNWIPSSRNALGSKRCFLPIESVDEQQCEMTLGRGEFKLKIPFAEPDPNWQMAILTPENDIKGIAAGQPQLNPKRDDVVFLGIDDQDRLIVLGFETMTPVLDMAEADAWKNHPITGCLIQGSKRLSLDSERLKTWIRAAGAALPVTVEGLRKNENQQLLFFSMRHQQDAALIPPSCISLASFIDLLPDGYTAILRCGGGFIPLPMRQIIPGLDKSFYAAAAKQLKQASVSFWLRREQNDFKVGFSDDAGNQDIFVKSLDILLENDDESEVGLVCQSIETKTLHWLPIQESAWTTLSATEFRDVFKSKAPFKVRRKSIARKNKIGITSNTDIISILAIPNVCEEFKKLTIGQELFIRVLKRVETKALDKQRYL